MAEVKQAHAGNQAYDENFYGAMKTDSYSYVTGLIQILSLVSKYIHPRSVVDVGCAIGRWLEFWQKNVGAEILGLDGDYVDRAQLSIDAKFFQPTNLELPIILNRRFDLAMTIEVAEHLTPARADSFVEDLTRLSDVILFSAAIPGQGGTNHVNEQFPSYWAKKFSNLGYVGIDCIRPNIWEDKRIDPRRKQNPFIYVKSTELYRYPELQEYYLHHRDSTVYDVVYPDLWIGRLIGFQNLLNQLQEQINVLKKSGGGQ